MKIAIIAPPFIPIPPAGYGGTERVIYNLAQGLVEIGQEVILFANKDSKTDAQTFLPYLENQKLDFGIYSPLAEKVIAAELGSKYAHAMAGYLGADIIHDHTLTDNFVPIPVVHTMHGPSTEASVHKCHNLSKIGGHSFVSISERQQEMYLTMNKDINFVANVYNSIDLTDVNWSAEKEDFFLFVGRINWEKGPALAIKIAAHNKTPLVMVVKMSEQFEKDFFTEEIQPLLDEFSKNLTFKLYEEPPTEFKYELYKKAKCTLFTSVWEEPFGLVMIESMACGTPVIALRRGAAPEVIIDGKTGFVVDTEEEMIEAAKDIDKIKPEDCRKYVEENFSIHKMAKDYLEVYKNILGEQK